MHGEKAAGRDVNAPSPRERGEGKGEGQCDRHVGNSYGAFTSIMPVAVRAEYWGRYISSTLAAGWA